MLPDKGGIASFVRTGPCVSKWSEIQRERLLIVYYDIINLNQITQQSKASISDCLQVLYDANNGNTTIAKDNIAFGT
jgi:hypothetical protein